MIAGKLARAEDGTGQERVEEIWRKEETNWGDIGREQEMGWRQRQEKTRVESWTATSWRTEAEKLVRSTAGGS